jgi:hypothetical protein
LAGFAEPRQVLTVREEGRIEVRERERPAAHGGQRTQAPEVVALKKPALDAGFRETE